MLIKKGFNPPYQYLVQLNTAIYKTKHLFNSDQHRQAISLKKFTGCLKQENIKIGMDGRGRCHDYIFNARL
jgi:hypothetical protein